MNRLFSKVSLVPVAAFVLASFTVTPAAEARGGARAGGGGGASSMQANQSRADTRTRDVRSTSVNNVNSSRSADRSTSRDVNRDVNVNVDVDADYRGGWDHPVAGAVVVGATVAAIGSMVATVPAGCVPVNYGGVVYQQCGSTWYAPEGSQFVVVNPPY